MANYYFNTPKISNTDDVIDSRDLETYIDHMREDIPSEEWPGEMQPVLEFAEEFKDYCPDYDYGGFAIHDMHFTEYVRDMVIEGGYITDELPWWISSHIDWEGVADEVKMDYSAIEFDGETYWTR